MEVGHEEGDDAEGLAKSHVVCQYPTGHSVRPLETVLTLVHPVQGSHLMGVEVGADAFGRL